MPTPDPVEAALGAHKTALEAQEHMTRLAAQRDEAIRAALDSGASAIHLAEKLGLTRQRIYAMAKKDQP